LNLQKSVKRDTIACLLYAFAVEQRAGDIFLESIKDDHSMINELTKVLAVTALVMFSAVVAADDDDRRGGGDHRESPDSRCLPTDAPVISASGVKTMSKCFHGSASIAVSGRTNPWDQTLNPTLVYSAPSDAFPPVVIALNTYGLKAGDYLSLTCVSGSTNAGGLPQTGCDGLKGFGFPPTDDVFQPACGTYYPSAFMDPSNFPTWVFQVVGVFTTSSGVVVGKPFPITPTTEFVVVPKRAAALQFGMNDCLNRDNSADSLTIKLVY
jgi:hypothetical protein